MPSLPSPTTAQHANADMLDGLSILTQCVPQAVMLARFNLMPRRTPQRSVQHRVDRFVSVCHVHQVVVWIERWTIRMIEMAPLVRDRDNNLALDAHCHCAKRWWRVAEVLHRLDASRVPRSEPAHLACLPQSSQMLSLHSLLSLSDVWLDAGIDEA